MACLQIYQESLSLTTFLRVHSNSKDVSYLYRQNTYPNLKITCHIKLKFFLWTKLLENLLIAKYLISLTASLKGWGVQLDIRPLVFPKMYSENVIIKIPQVVLKIWRFSPSILTLFIYFSDFLKFPNYE